jgi:hypothetical protein
LPILIEVLVKGELRATGADVPSEVPTAIVADIPREVNEAIGKRIVDYSVGLVKLSDTNGGDARLGGSGTLVKFGERRSTLTAAHVVDYLWGSTEFGLVIPQFPSGKPHRLTFQTQLFEKILMPRERRLTPQANPLILR